MTHELGGGQRQPALAQVGVQAAQQIGDPDHEANPAPGLARGRAGRAEDRERGERDLAADRLEVLLERGERRRRRPLQLALAGVDRGLEPGARKGEPGERPVQRLHDRMGERPVGGGRLQRVAPPLEADQPGHRLAHDVAHLADFVVEGVEREQRLARVLRREQG